MEIQLANEKITINEPTKLEDLAKSIDFKPVCALVDNRLRELTYVIEKDAKIEFLGVHRRPGQRIYEASLRYLMAMALYNIKPTAHITFTYNISRCVMCYITSQNRKKNYDLFQEIKDEMNRLIKLDLPINRLNISIDEAIDIYNKEGYKDKVRLLHFRPENDVNVYECNGYYNYMFGYMVPSTGYLSDFKLIAYNPGIILQYPRSDMDGKIPEFENAPKYNQTLFESYKWSKICEGNSISDLNKHVANESAIDFINMCETRQNNMLAQLGNNIKENENIRLIAIAGPSSSGKTTFANRLRIELMSKGFKPVMISIDDYYLPKAEAPLDEEGKPDLEHIEALDIKLFNQDMLNLIQGNEVTLPRFNFKTGLREKGKTIRVNEDEPIVIEGIHALNERLTSLIPRYQKYKIYIAPHIQMRIDDHNPINMTDVRLLRRMVRDKNYRNTDCIKTLEMWSSVRRGEFNWIYPTQEDADYVFPSELTYELCVMKKYAMPMLEAIPNDSPYFITANRLIKFLKYFKSIDDKWIPCNSLLREFIGGSCFNV